MTKDQKMKKQEEEARMRQWIHDRAYQMGKDDARKEFDKELKSAALKGKIDMAHQLNGLVESTARAVIAMIASIDKDKL